MITNKDFDHGNAFDFGKCSADYAKFRDIYPELFYQRIIDLDCVSMVSGFGLRHRYRRVTEKPV